MDLYVCPGSSVTPFPTHREQQTYGGSTQDESLLTGYWNHCRCRTVLSTASVVPRAQGRNIKGSVPQSSVSVTSTILFVVHFPLPWCNRGFCSYLYQITQTMNDRCTTILVRSVPFYPVSEKCFGHETHHSKISVMGQSLSLSRCQSVCTILFLDLYFIFYVYTLV